jgi:hypothetical protein
VAIKISDLIEPPVSVEVSARGSIELRALNLQEIVNLLLTYQDSFVTIYAEGMSAKPNFSGIMIAAPDMIVDLIAIAADAVGQEADIKRLPATVQLSALVHIWKQSVPNPKELRELLSQVMGQLRQLSLTQPVATEQLSEEKPVKSSKSH